MAIDIKKLNQDYTKENAALAKLTAPGGLKDQIQVWETGLHNLKKDYTVKQLDYELAKSKNDKTSIQKLEKDIEAIKKQMEALLPKLRKANTILTQQQQKVDARIEELSKDPETKQKLDSILYKKYDRKRKAETNKKKQLETIKEIVDSHPNVKKWLDGIEGYNKTIKKCNQIITELSAKPILTITEEQQKNKAALDLATAQNKLAARKKDLVDFFAKHHPEIDKKILEELHSYNNINRQIHGCDKTVANCTKAMSNLSVYQELKSFTNSTHDTSLPTVAEEKPSWLHPIKRIKYEINSRRSRKEAEAQNTESRNEQRKSFKDDLKLSKDEYQADIVQKYLENYEKGLHEAAKQNRGNGGNSR